MLNKILPVSVTICTLNEEKNISKCIESMMRQNPYEIILVDGSSNDKTVEIAKKYNVKVIIVDKKGLAYQRKIAVENCSQKYIAIMDADHRPDLGSFEKMIHQLTITGFDGIEAFIYSVKNKSFWDWSMEQNFILSHNIVRETDMIGTPCIYKAEVLKLNNFDPFFTASSDDTDLSYRLIKKGFRLGICSAIVRQEHRSEMKTFIKKLIWYGKGDAQFVYKHPERLFHMLKHHYYNYPLKKSFYAIKKLKFQVIPFFIMYGLIRNFSFVKEIFKLLFVSRNDKDIYST
jgi:glycosyltransferase involved in cell wall biosynthesis